MSVWDDDEFIIIIFIRSALRVDDKAEVMGRRSRLFCVCGGDFEARGESASGDYFPVAFFFHYVAGAQTAHKLSTI